MLHILDLTKITKGFLQAEVFTCIKKLIVLGKYSLCLRLICTIKNSMNKILSCLKDKYVVAGLVYGLADGIFEIFDNWAEFFLYLILYILVIYFVEFLNKKFLKN